jgi:hypothetical protein
MWVLHSAGRGVGADSYIANMTKRRITPRVGGQSAALIYQLIESLPIVIGVDDSIDFEQHLCRAHVEVFRHAYEHVEQEFLIEYENCPCGDQHEPLEPAAWRFLVIHAMADQAREALGIRSPHRFWC